MINSLTAQIQKSKLKGEEKNLVLRQCVLIIDQFYQQGIDVYGRGSSIRTSNVVKGKGYSINIKANFSANHSIVNRFMDWIKG